MVYVSGVKKQDLDTESPLLGTVTAPSLCGLLKKADLVSSRRWGWVVLTLGKLRPEKANSGAEV